jgi:uncharacterized protein
MSRVMVIGATGPIGSCLVPRLVRGGHRVIALSRGTREPYHASAERGSGTRCEPYLTAEAGFLGVSLDAAGHGDRRRADFDVIFDPERWDADFEATETDFLKLIDDTAAEVPVIIDDLLARGWARPDRLGICGRSLGGNVSYAAMLADQRLRAAAPIVGSPEWTLPRAHSPHHHPDRFFPAAILSQAAEFDEYVPAGPIRDFHAALEPWYAAEPGRIEYVEYQGVGHFLTPELTAESCQRLVAWFRRWLPRG